MLFYRSAWSRSRAVAGAVLMGAAALWPTFDPGFSHGGLWIVAYAVAWGMSYLALPGGGPFAFSLRRLARHDAYLLIGLTLTAAFVHGLYLDRYPFSLVTGDLMLDGGSYPQAIAQGKIGNWFAFGRGFTQLVFLPNFLAYKIFGASRWTVLGPSPLFATIDIPLVYLWIAPRWGRLAAVASALCLLGSPVHLSFARLDTVVAAGGTFAVILLGALFRTLEERRLAHLARLALLVGLSACFHGAAILFAALASIVAAANLGFRWRGWRRLAEGFTVLCAFLAFALAPFFRATDLPRAGRQYVESRAPDEGKSERRAWGHLKRALLSYTDPGAHRTYNTMLPALAPGLAPLFFLGAAGAFVAVRTPLGMGIVALATLFPLALSQLHSSWIDYRQLPLCLLSAVLVGIAARLVFFLPPVLARAAAAVVLGAVMHSGATQARSFFVDEPLAGPPENVSAFPYLYHYVVHSIAEEASRTGRKHFCVQLSPRNQQEAGLAHFQQATAFLLPGQSVELRPDHDYSDNEARIGAACGGKGPTTKIQRLCEIAEPFRCPRRGGPLTLYQDL